VVNYPLLKRRRDTIIKTLERLGCNIDNTLIIYLDPIEKGGYIYIMSNASRTTLYIGVTSNLHQRVLDHKSGIGSKFTSEYKCKTLVYYEVFDCIEAAIEREKRLKKWKRSYKDDLIKSINPDKDDLTPQIIGFD
jgi:putative endonuclease